MNKRLFRWTPAAILVIAGSTHSLGAGPFGATVNLSSLNGTNGFVCNGIVAGDYSGYSVSGAGDINGDGIDDLIIGASHAGPGGLFERGESYVVFGDDGIGAGGTIELSSLNGTNGFVLVGIDGVDRSGRSVSEAGDINGDGIGDLIIGAYLADPNGSQSGESYVIFGDVGIGAGGTIGLSSLNGTNGFVINGIDAGDKSGGSVSSAGDINGDGVDDIIIGANCAGPFGTFANRGESYVVFGGVGVGSSGTIELSSLNGTNGFVCNGVDNDDSSGFSVSGAGDVNGDGVDDLAIGAFTANPNGVSQSGASYVVFGGAGVGSGGSIDLSSLNGTNGFVCNGIGAFDLSGFSVSGAGDVNGDGVDDLIIGAVTAAPSGVSDAGASHVVFGGIGIGSGGTIELSSLDGTNGFTCNGFRTEGHSGYSVAGAGDINGDGISDLIIGANGDSYGAGPGESYVVFGGNSVGAGGVMNLLTLHLGVGAAGDFGFFIRVIGDGDSRGISVSCAGDVNGDGVSDIIVGGSRADPNGEADSGESYVIFGIGSEEEALPGDVNGDDVVDAADLGILLGMFGMDCK